MQNFISKTVFLAILAFTSLSSLANEEAQLINERNFECTETYLSVGRTSHSHQYSVNLSVKEYKGSFQGAQDNQVEFSQKFFEFTNASPMFGLVKNFSLMKFKNSVVANENVYLCEKNRPGNCRGATGWHIPNYIPSTYSNINLYDQSFSCNLPRCGKAYHTILDFKSQGIIHYEKTDLSVASKRSYIACHQI